MSPSELPSPAATTAPLSLLQYRSFLWLWCTRTTTTAAFHMQGVAVGWQLYEMTGSPIDLGIVGFIQFLPLVVFNLVVGQVTDRYDRRAILRNCQIIKVTMVGLLALGTAMGWLTREWMFALLLVASTARAFEMPSMQALIPSIVPVTLLPRAIAAAATAQQTAIISGPAIGGLLYLLGPVTVYATCAIIYAVAAVLVSLIQLINDKQDKRPITLESVFAGFSFIWNRKVLFGVMSLDLFVVLVGGITALLPIFAKDILQTGPWGLGLLRSAPAVGALTASVVLARWSIEAKAGKILFLSVAAFGISTAVFSLSTSLVLSLIALVGYGAADAISVVIRHSMVQTRTPTDMLGRVITVNSMFTGSSGSLGEFRAGMMAAWLGAVPAALFGGIGAIAVVLIWMRLFPEIGRIDKLNVEEKR
ncbi:MAG: MFS transporter [Xanthobacteraceae bacterium]|nr:MFS transporter [Xanthobacteraceae bacterium]